jgi:5'-nucleotidase (lipoprotein e(P4) family)
MRQLVVVAAALACLSATGSARQWPGRVSVRDAVPQVSVQPRPAETHLEIKYVRDSAEYATLARQVYRQATAAVRSATAALGAERRWAVVLDIDETALDNSPYQLERAAYHQPYEPPSWKAWVARGEARAVPGVNDFVVFVRKAGGRVAWISNRDEGSREPTRRNLVAVALWEDDDRLCLASKAGDPKAVRRREVMTGAGTCGWGVPVEILAFVGDQMVDFPERGESLPDAGQDEAFGTRFFIMPNPMYGAWTSTVTSVNPR